MRARIGLMCLALLGACDTHPPIVDPADVPPEDIFGGPDGDPAPQFDWLPEAIPWVDHPTHHPFRARVAANTAIHLTPSADGRHVFAHGNAQIELIDADGPVVVGSIPLQGIHHLVARQEVALAASSRDLHVLDVSDPAAPQIVSTYQHRAQFLSIALSNDGTTAYAVTDPVGGHTLFVFDLTPPDGPTVRHSMHFDDLSQVRVLDDGLLVTAHETAIVIRDLSDPADPQVAGRLEGLSRGPWGRIRLRRGIDDRTLFARTETTTLIIDIADRVAPQVVGRMTLGDRDCLPRAIDAETMVVSVAGTLHQLDIGAPDAPRLVRTFELPRPTCASAVLPDGRVLVPTARGMLAIDRRNPSARAPTPIAEIIQYPTDLKLSADGRHVFAGGTDLTIFDIEAPSPPLARLEMGEYGAAASIALSPNNQRVYLAGGDHLSIIDVQDLAAPMLLGAWRPDRDGRPAAVSLSADGETAFVATALPVGLFVLDVGEPDAPRQTGMSPLGVIGSVATGVGATPDDGHLFVSQREREGLALFDMADPTRPARLRLDLGITPSAIALSADGARLAVLGASEDHTAAITLFDITDPPNPAVDGTFGQRSGARGLQMTADGRAVHFVDEWQGLQMYDVSDPTAPVLAGAFDVAGEAWDVVVTPDARHAALISGTEEDFHIRTLALGDAPILTPLDATEPGVRRFQLSWSDLYPADPEQIAWHATAGDVAVHAIDQHAHTAVVDWTGASGGETLSVAVGNRHAFRSVSVQAP